MGLQQVRGAEGGKGRRRQGLGLLGGNSCLSGHISWVGLLAPPPSHCPMTVILMELDVWEGTPILLFLSSDSLAPLITEIVILSPTHPKSKTTKSESLCCPPPSLSQIHLFPLVLHDSTGPLVIPGEICDYERVKVDCITCWFT